MPRLRAAADPLETARRLAGCLREHGGCVETPYDGRRAAAEDGDGLYLELSTRTAYGLELARLLAAELGHRLALPEERVADIELAVHEGLINGLVHGNLGISAPSPRSPEQFSAYCRRVERALSADGEGGRRRIAVAARWDAEALEVAVRDQGAGYEPDRRPIHMDDSRTLGQGLTLIAALTRGMTVSGHGRTLTMRFSR
ncbi:hypothetical protein GALL_292340 [mine drainage metagenome]|uniref:Histidine kinase/HSP90-like ATPase domain-containing protein n=1 Tax=mine drainage metagenome TaxID=410659 RepID=A0A1J5RL36_9ZZZZ